jgi:hypothetical protein
MTRVIFGSKDNTRVYCATVTDFLARDSGHFINNKTFVRIWCIGDTKDIHCKKRLAVFPSPAGMSLTKLSLAGNNLIIPGHGEFGQ